MRNGQPAGSTSTALGIAPVRPLKFVPHSYGSFLPIMSHWLIPTITSHETQTATQFEPCGILKKAIADAVLMRVKAATPFEFLCLTGLVTSDGSERPTIESTG